LHGTSRFYDADYIKVQSCYFQDQFLIGSFQRIQTRFSDMYFIFSYPATQPDSLIRQLIKSLAMPDTID